MNCLNEVLYKPDFNSETKLHARIAVGDSCLAIEEEFLVHFEKCMDCLMSAAQVSV